MEDKIDKIYDLITKMYSDIDNRLGSLERGQKELIVGQEDLKKDQKKLELKIEHSIEPKVQALFEDREVIHKKLDTIENDVKTLSAKVEKQELEIRVIKGGKAGDTGDKPKGGRKKKAQ